MECFKCELPTDEKENVLLYYCVSCVGDTKISSFKTGECAECNKSCRLLYFSIVEKAVCNKCYEKPCMDRCDRCEEITLVKDGCLIKEPKKKLCLKCAVKIFHS